MKISINIALVCCTFIKLIQSDSITRCNETIASKPLHLCSKVDTYQTAKPRKKAGNPIDVENLITLSSISKLNVDEETFTIELVIKMIWNDTRVTLANNYQNE